MAVDGFQVDTAAVARAAGNVERVRDELGTALRVSGIGVAPRDPAGTGPGWNPNRGLLMDAEALTCGVQWRQRIQVQIEQVATIAADLRQAMRNYQERDRERAGILDRI